MMQSLDIHTSKVFKKGTNWRFLTASSIFDSFMNNKIKFNMIYDVIYRTFDVMPMSKILEIESIYEIDKQSRMEAHKVVKSIS